VTPEQALTMQTLSAASCCDRGATEGSLAPGKRANLVVLDRDPVDGDPSAASVLQTWVDGELRWSRDGSA
jgi:imidazolonepropionase-like amidohydrolase